jgi:NAD(P)-dependent dehydrogenase (short-subunit alcohol dehydrogenase family)
MAGDAGNEASVKGFIDGAVSAFGALDVVHANAGVSGGRVPIFEQTEEYWTADFADQSDRAVSGDQTRRHAHGGTGPRFDHPYVLGRGPRR